MTLPSVGIPDDGDRAGWATGRLLSTAARIVEQSWNARLREDRVSHAGLIVLSLLRSGPATQRELARSQHLTEQTIARTLAHLEATGHVRRATDPTDRRRRTVALTIDGEAVLHEMSGRSQQHVDRVLTAGGLDAAAFRAALDLLIATYAAEVAGRPDD